MKRILLAAVFFCFAVTMMGQETYDGVALRTDLQTFVKKVKAKGYTIEKQSEGSCELRGEYMMKYAGRITVETDSDSNSILDISGTYEFESEEEAQKAFQDIYETQKGNYRWRQSDMSCMAKSRRFMVVMYFETSTSFIIKLHLIQLQLIVCLCRLELKMKNKDNQKHLTLSQRIEIEQGLNLNKSYAEISVARIQADLERENQTRAAELEKLNLIREADSEVERNIASLNSEPIPTTVPELLQSLTALSVQLKANPWKKEGEDAERRNKYTEALLEKFVLSVQELEFIDSTDPHLKHFKAIVRKVKRKKFFKNNGKWIIPLIVTVSVIILATLPFLIMPLIDFFMDNPVWFYTIIVVCIGAFTAIKLLKKPNKQSIKSDGPTGYNKTEERQPYLKEQAPKTETIQVPEPEPEPEQTAEESVFFDLNENERIEKKLAYIWTKCCGYSKPRRWLT